MSLPALVYDVGVNDADYAVQKNVGGRTIRCPYYRAWSNMLKRSYSPSQLVDAPTYADCTVATEWLVFSNFKAWMEKQDWKGKQLDKDVLWPGNKMYGPDTCCFVDSSVNCAVAYKQTNTTTHYPGVSYHKHRKCYVAQCFGADGEKHYRSGFKTPREAFRAYAGFKIQAFATLADRQSDSRVAIGLYRHAVDLAKNSLQDSKP